MATQAYAQKNYVKRLSKTNSLDTLVWRQSHAPQNCFFSLVSKQKGARQFQTCSVVVFLSLPARSRASAGHRPERRAGYGGLRARRVGNSVCIATIPKERQATMPFLTQTCGQESYNAWDIFGEYWRGIL